MCVEVQDIRAWEKDLTGIFKGVDAKIFWSAASGLIPDPVRETMSYEMSQMAPNTTL